MKNNNDILVQVNNLKKYFPIRRGFFSKISGHVKAVNDVSFDLYRGETLGLVGESGCGKTTVGRLILRLLDATEGTITFEGRDLSQLDKRAMRKIRREMQVIFQDPYSSLNPRMTVGNMLTEALKVHKIVPKIDVQKEVHRLMDIVGLPRAHASRYPHEFSGGQRQRIGIARALSVRPKLIICDEAVSALDVSIQAQVINLLRELQKEFGLTYLFIAHDLSVVEYISDRVIVMYLGKIMEIADAAELYKNTLHPYSEALLSAVPIPDPGKKSNRIVLKGDIPSPANPPSGCAFHPRCQVAMMDEGIQEECAGKIPELISGSNKHFVACHQRTP
ncbi:MAG: ATP-binding cassette domain-containing protein [Candidatus Marinimicrobia bacterium]|nr:ATP-binding cassette domain-containing protein [Candidatus Neomarinimicrobiota bacterium]